MLAIEWLNTLMHILLTEDEEACLALLQSVNPTIDAALVPLVEGLVEPLEALAYARTLLELGQDLVAAEIVQAVLATGPSLIALA